MASAIYIYQEWSFTSISSLNPCFFTAHRICTIKAYKSCSWYVNTSLWQYFFNFIYNHFRFCGRDWLQCQKIKTKWIWIFIKITYILIISFLAAQVASSANKTISWAWQALSITISLKQVFIYKRKESLLSKDW